MTNSTQRRLLLIKPAHIVDGKQRPGPAQFPISLFHLDYVADLTPSDWDIPGMGENLRMEDCAGWITDLVGITVLTPAAPRAYTLTRRYRNERAHVVLGGIDVSTLPNRAAQYADTIGDADRFQLGLAYYSSSAHHPATDRERRSTRRRRPRDCHHTAGVKRIGRSVVSGGVPTTMSRCGRRDRTGFEL